MFSGSKKPYTAITVQVDRLTSEQYEEDSSSGIPDLVEVIRIQPSGPTEAARAIRKKLKYGNPHRQLRALVILDGLIQNAGSKFQRTFADEPLLERLRLLPRDDVVDPQVRQKCQVLFTQWSHAYKNTPGLERIANLYKELPKTSRPQAQAARQKVLQDTGPFEDDSDYVTTPAGRSRTASSAGTSTSITPVSLTPAASSYTSRLSKGRKSGSNKPFNLSKEKENMTNAIAQSSIASTNLLNGLQLINRETERVSDNQEVYRRFETCKNLRRQILYYIQHVESDQWIGSLVNANDELIKALTAFEILDKSIDDDSDSDAVENMDSAPNAASSPARETQRHLEGLSLDSGKPKPSRPNKPGNIPLPPKPAFAKPPVVRAESEGEEDDDNPFGDAHATSTPYQERDGLTWRDVQADHTAEWRDDTLKDRLNHPDEPVKAPSPDEDQEEDRICQELYPELEQRPLLTEDNIRAVIGEAPKSHPKSKGKNKVTREMEESVEQEREQPPRPEIRVLHHDSALGPWPVNAQEHVSGQNGAQKKKGTRRFFGSSKQKKKSSGWKDKALKKLGIKKDSLTEAGPAPRAVETGSGSGQEATSCTTPNGDSSEEQVPPDSAERASPLGSDASTEELRNRFREGRPSSSISDKVLRTYVEYHREEHHRRGRNQALEDARLLEHKLERQDREEQELAQWELQQQRLEEQPLDDEPDEESAEEAPLAS